MKILKSILNLASGKYLGSLLLTAVCAVTATNAMAVTDEEMDHARAIAAMYYIRYVNNASGYLDGWQPGSVSELEGKLQNDKDKESLRQFKDAGRPSDFASWDKAKLEEYWSTTFFKNNAARLDPKGANNGQAKMKIKNAIAGMKVAHPVQEPAAPEPEPAPAEISLPTPASDIATPETNDPMVIEQEMEDVANQIAEDSAKDAAEAQMPEEKKSSNTWVYIMVLAILVVIVIFLVSYASKTMKGQSRRSRSLEDFPDDEDDDIPAAKSDVKTVRVVHTVEEPVAKITESKTPSHHIPTPYDEKPLRSLAEDPALKPLVKKDPELHAMAAETRMRERYAEQLAGKTEEIRILTRQLADMENLAAKLKEDNRRLRAELDELRSAGAAPAVASVILEEPEVEKEPRRAAREVHEVFLGRVNSRGIFVRADRHAVEGQSIYRLTTQNGTSGTYSLLNDPLVEEQVLSDPGKWLVGGCFAKDIMDTEGRYGVTTETPGTAVFKDGAWRVERKAKIRYE